VQQALEKTGLFSFVERDQTAQTTAVIPNDPYFSSAWHLAKIQAPNAWDLTTGSSAITIAVVDSGVDPANPDVAPKLVPGWNFLTGDSNTADSTGHGTAVASVAAAATNNGVGVSGVAWANPVMPVVVVNSAGSASYSDIASGITYAADHGARIINVSVAGSSSSSTLQSAINHAWNKGAIIIAAAGNSSTSTPYYPAACNNTVAVSSTTSVDTLSSFSNFGSWIDVAAPGESIPITSQGGYGSWSGTSFSSPITAGVAALMLSINPGLSNSTAVSLLKSNADDLGSSGFDSSFGSGRINAYRAVMAAAGSGGDTTAPVASISSPTASATVSGSIQIQGTAADNSGIVNVELWIDGVLSTSVSSSPFSFTWNSAGIANGTHTLSVKAYDPAGNVGQASISVSVSNPTIADTQPPTDVIMQPLGGSKLGPTTTINVSATDNVAVSQVSIYIDGVLQYTGTSAPFSYKWNSRKATAGSHTITSKAWDMAGNTAASSPVIVVK
jgi:subtilisin family serine protease